MARAAGPMRVARAQREPWGTPPARDFEAVSCPYPVRPDLPLSGVLPPAGSGSKSGQGPRVREAPGAA